MVEMGQIMVFVQELGLKTFISVERNLDLGPKNFEMLPFDT